MEIETKDAVIEFVESCRSDVVLRCTRKIVDGSYVDPKTQVPTIISLDNYTAYNLAIKLLQKIDVVDTRGFN